MKSSGQQGIKGGNYCNKQHFDAHICLYYQYRRKSLCSKRIIDSVTNKSRSNLNRLRTCASTSDETQQQIWAEATDDLLVGTVIVGGVARAKRHPIQLEHQAKNWTHDTQTNTPTLSQGYIKQQLPESHINLVKYAREQLSRKQQVAKVPEAEQATSRPSLNICHKEEWDCQENKEEYSVNPEVCLVTELEEYVQEGYDEAGALQSEAVSYIKGIIINKVLVCNFGHVLNKLAAKQPVLKDRVSTGMYRLLYDCPVYSGGPVIWEKNRITGQVRAAVFAVHRIQSLAHVSHALGNGMFVLGLDECEPLITQLHQQVVHVDQIRWVVGYRRWSQGDLQQSIDQCKVHLANCGVDTIFRETPQVETAVRVWCRVMTCMGGMYAQLASRALAWAWLRHNNMQSLNKVRMAEIMGLDVAQGDESAAVEAELKRQEDEYEKTFGYLPNSSRKRDVIKSNPFLRDLESVMYD